MSRPQQTLADFLVAAICPALIMLLVGSLVFFLVEVFYQGFYPTRLLFVMAMFVLAIVCVARISMQEGSGYAALFGLPLAVVVGIAVSAFVQVQGPLAAVGPVINWGLLALVWWSAHKLTWDCTLIDDTQDFTGEGLLQTMGLAESAAEVGPTPPPPSGEEGSWWTRWFEQNRRPHAPGVWVVYFSLAALPLFGLGQWFIPESNSDLRRRAFWLLAIYTASGLSLLVATSFLGLRRYLRQRRVEMPASITAVWLAWGGALVLALLVVAALLPRPAPEYSLAQSLIEFGSRQQQASDYGQGPDGGEDQDQSAEPTAEQGSGEPQPGGESGKAEPGEQGEGEKGAGGSQSGGKTSSGEQGSQGEQSGQSQQPAGEKAGEQSQSKQGGQGGEKAGEKSAGEKGAGEKAGKNQGGQGQQGTTPQNQQPQQQSQQLSQQQPQPAPRSSPPISLGSLISGLGWLMQILFWAVVIGAALYFGWRYREELLAAWKKLLAELAELWAKLFGRGVAEAPAAVAAPASPPSKTFRDFADPFASGRAKQMPLAELVRYTFSALEAWGRDRQLPRAPGQTPLEYAQALAELTPPLAAARPVADLYCQLAFAPKPAASNVAASLQNLWTVMNGERTI